MSEEVKYIPYQCCPKCGGQGIVTKPPYVCGDVHEWSSAFSHFTCDVCDGKKIIPMHAPDSGYTTYGQDFFEQAAAEEETIQMRGNATTEIHPMDKAKKEYFHRRYYGDNTLMEHCILAFEDGFKAAQKHFTKTEK